MPEILEKEVDKKGAEGCERVSKYKKQQDGKW